MKLKEMREAQGLSQRDLAKKISLDAGMVSRFENYKCLPTPEKMQVITSVLGCDVKDIYTEHEIFYKKSSKKRNKKKSGRYHLSGYLPEEARKLLDKMVTALGYESITAWLNDCYQKLIQEYKERGNE